MPVLAVDRGELVHDPRAHTEVVVLGAPSEPRPLEAVSSKPPTLSQAIRKATSTAADEQTPAAIGRSLANATSMGGATAGASQRPGHAARQIEPGGVPSRPFRLPLRDRHRQPLGVVLAHIALTFAAGNV